MKTSVIKFTSAIAFTVVLFACGNNEQKNSQTEGQAPNSENEAVAVVKPSQVDPLVQHYIHLKNALVSSNIQEAKSGAKGMLDASGAIDTSAFSGEQKTVWHAQINKIRENAQHISEAPELAHQREHLGALTESMYALIKAFGPGKKLYYDYCPMANDNKGGFWLSENEDIKNPYFGDEMLTCGEVKETVK